MAGEANGGTHDTGHVKMNGQASNEHASSSRGQNDTSSSGTMPEEAAMHPSSWPPPSQRNLMSHVSHWPPHQGLTVRAVMPWSWHLAFSPGKHRAYLNIPELQLRLSWHDSHVSNGQSAPLLQILPVGWWKLTLAAMLP